MKKKKFTNQFIKAGYIFSISLLILLCYSCTEKKVEKPNILFIAVDDLRPELGCYGNRDIISPNIDRLANSGIVFNNAYCQQSLCNPSRASLLTGMRPDAIKVWDLGTHFRSVVPDAVTLPEFFKNQGYRVEGLGKIFHDNMGDQQSLSHPQKVLEGVSGYPDTTMQRLLRHKMKEIQLRERGVPENQIPGRPRVASTMCVDDPENNFMDGALTEMAIDFIKEFDEPFFLAVGFYKPHLPFVAPRKYFDLYVPEKIPPAKNPFLPEVSPDISMNTMAELKGYADFTGALHPLKAAYHWSKDKC